jgi:phospholipase C
VPCVIVSPWTQGGYVAGEPFDHTSVLRFLERITGVQETNISDWRRRTFGDLTSALGLSAARPFPALPDTKAQFWAAEDEVATLPPATFPGADQTPPHQETPGAQPDQTPASPAPDPSAPAAAHPPYTVSRIVENATTHRSDFPDGTAGTNFPGIQEAVPGVGPTSGTYLYAVGVVSFTLAVIDPATRQLVASVKAGVSPYGLTKASGGKLYLSSSGENSVSVYNTGTGKVTSSIRVGAYPHGLATSPDGGSVYAANTGPDTGPGGSQTLSVIDTASDKVTATWTSGTAPHSLVTGTDGKSLYVSCSDGLSVMDTGTGEQQALLTDQAGSNGVAVHPDGTRLYVVNTWQGTLSVIDTRTLRVLARVGVGRTPWQVAVSPDGTRVYVTNSKDDTVSVIDAAQNRVTATVAVKHVPTGITATASTLWVATNASSTVDAIDAKSLKPLGSTALGLTTSPAAMVIA